MENLTYLFQGNHLRTTEIVNFPKGITSLEGTFFNCSNLEEAPNIPDTVTDLNSTFENCINLTKAPKIPNSVENMHATFCKCTNLQEAPIIPENVTDMCETFACCLNLEGDIYIYSDKVEYCDWCFYGILDNELNLHIHKDTLTWKKFEEYLEEADESENIHLIELKR